MAVYWNLGLRTETKAAALACEAFFRQKRLVIDEVQADLEVWLDAVPGGWFVGVSPRGVSVGEPGGRSDSRLTGDEILLRIAQIFDAWLREAPPFRAADFGREAADFWSDREWDGCPTKGWAGLVIDEATWEQMGRPDDALKVGAGRLAWPRSNYP